METKKASPKKRCPYDYEFGKDTDFYEECVKCEFWDDCLKQQNNELKKPLIKTESPKTTNMKETLEQLRSMFACEKFIVTGSQALKVYGLVKKANDIDIILVNPTQETKEMIVRFQDKMPAQTKAQTADEQYGDHSLLAIFKWNGVKVDVFGSTGEETLNIDGFEYAMILHIVKAKREANRLKDWLQLRKLASQFWTREGMAKWLDDQEKAL